MWNRFWYLYLIMCDNYIFSFIRNCQNIQFFSRSPRNTKECVPHAHCHLVSLISFILAILNHVMAPHPGFSLLLHDEWCWASSHVLATFCPLWWGICTSPVPVFMFSCLYVCLFVLMYNETGSCHIAQAGVAQVGTSQVAPKLTIFPSPGLLSVRIPGVCHQDLLELFYF